MRFVPHHILIWINLSTIGSRYRFGKDQSCRFLKGGGESGIARLILSLTLRAARYGPACGGPESFPTIPSNLISIRGFSSGYSNTIALAKTSPTDS